MKIIKLSCLTFLLFLLSSCAAKHLKYDNVEQLKKNDEFETAVKIVAPPLVSSPTVTDKSAIPSELKSDERNKKKQLPKPQELILPEPKKKKVVKKTPQPEEKILVHEPELEDPVNFIGRRPIKDPFRVGETVVHNVHYYSMSAGNLTLRVDPYVEVNGRKSYSFVTEMRTGTMFSKFYSVENIARTVVDFDLMIPRAFEYHVKESGQLKEARSIFDHEKAHATYWEKKVTEKNGKEEKKQQWSILPFSQNVFSAIFYMRNFPWETGKEYAFRFADDEENLVLKGQAIRREVLKTELGPMKAIVVRPQVMAKGNFKPVGDIFIWLSDDDRKLVLRIETNIKIGTLVSEVINIIPGQEP